MIRFLARIVLYLALAPYATFFGVLLGLRAAEVYRVKFYKNTYISTIELSPYMTELTKKALTEFNSFADNKIISFKPMENGRPVTIQKLDNKLKIVYDNAIGLALEEPTKCSIYIIEELSEQDFKETLIHEYLHCLGYDHTFDPKDLMYPSLKRVDKTENTRQYARKVLKKYYE